MNRNDGPEDGNGALRCLIFNPVVADDEILGFHDNLQNGRPHCAVL
jgi:hypothetical protein